MNLLVFDIETIPDVQLGRRALGLRGLDDEQVAKAMFASARALTGSDFLPLEQHQVVAISCVMRSGEQLRVWSLGDLKSTEAEIIGRFYEGIEKFSPELVSWNGAGFDLPVLHYRALRAGVQAPRYWEMGDEDREFRFNNYLNRYHWRHIDLMDVLSGFQGRARASLEDMAALLELPGKMGFSGDQVWDAYCSGQLAAIRNYCETDVLNTYLVYLRFEFMRGRLDTAGLARESQRVRDVLAASSEPHHAQFLAMLPDTKSG
jgi:predicted PolB exonuclease-like 3'-5' exonuclease